MGPNPILDWRREWQPTPVFLPGKSHERRNLVGYTLHGVAKNQTQLSDFTFTFTQSNMRACVCACSVISVMSDSLRPHGR